MNNERPAPKQYEAWLIQLLRLRFEQANFKVEDHLKVGELSLEIDMIVITPSEACRRISRSCRRFIITSGGTMSWN